MISSLLTSGNNIYIGHLRKNKNNTNRDFTLNISSILRKKIILISTKKWANNATDKTFSLNIKMKSF